MNGPGRVLHWTCSFLAAAVRLAICAVLILVVCVDQAQAAFPATQNSGNVAPSSFIEVNTSNPGATAAAACTFDQPSSGYTWSGGSLTAINGVTRFYCWGSLSGGTPRQFAHVFAVGACPSGYTFDHAMQTCAGTASYSCPANATLSGQSCSCNTGFVEKNNQCLSAAAAVCDVFKGQTFYMSAPGGSSPGGSVCTAIGCAGTWSSMVVKYTDKTTGKTVSEGDVTYTGAACTYQAEQPANATKQDCPGGYLGTINDKPTCVPRDPGTNVIESTKSETSTKTNTTTNPDGTTTTNNESTSQTQNTKCENGVCTTTTTTTGTVNGRPVSSTTTDSKGQNEFCKENPNNSACETKDKGSFEGNCDSGFACKGDAVECALAREVFTRNCQMHKAVQADVDKGTEARTAGVPDGFFTVRGELSSLVPNAPQATSCPFKRTAIMVGPMPLDMDLTGVCQYTDQIKAIVVAFGGLLWLFIVLGKQKGG